MSSEPSLHTNYIEKVIYVYILQDLLERVEAYDDTYTLTSVVEYKYNPPNENESENAGR